MRADRACIHGSKSSPAVHLLVASMSLSRSAAPACHDEDDYVSGNQRAERDAATDQY
jgi:hypothetical protein